VTPGDLFFVRVRGKLLQFAKAENPFDALGRQAWEEYKQGKTKSLRALAQELDVDLSADQNAK
jgi:hypothetical protein